MQYQVIDDAKVLTPNPSHLNFTENGEVIKKGTVVDGKEQFITGKRRGQPFKYRLFITNDNKLIHLNKVKPMETTEVTLGADAAQTPTQVTIVSPKLLSKYTVIGGLTGAVGGYLLARKKKWDMKNTALVVIALGAAGFFIGHKLEKKGVFVKPSK